MGTSGSYGGPSGRAPLIPSWLGGAVDGPAAAEPAAPTGGDAQAGPANPGAGPAIPPAPPARPGAVPPSGSNRFVSARSNFSRFAGGAGTSSLGRAVSQYVSTTAGGAGTAARRMRAPLDASAALLGFMADAQRRGTPEAIRALNLGGLAGRSIEDVFLVLADYVCPDGGTIDNGIARAAFVETIADLASIGITDLDALTNDQMEAVLERYAAHAIEARICNDIGANIVTLPKDPQAAAQVEAQLLDLVRRGVSDAVDRLRPTLNSLTADQTQGFIRSLYEEAFSILQALGDDLGES